MASICDFCAFGDVCKRKKDLLPSCDSFVALPSIPQDAVAFYGSESQQWVFVGEVGELMDALSDYRRGRCGVDHIAEEIADVEIMLKQLKTIYHCHFHACDWYQKKLKKLAENLVKEMNKKNVH